LDVTKLKELVTFLHSEDIEVLTLITETVGNLLRNQENRKQLGTLEGFVSLVTKLLQHTNEEIKYFAIRAIANLCFNHGKYSISSSSPNKIDVRRHNSICMKERALN
jgi:hypothetical protein